MIMVYVTCKDDEEAGKIVKDLLQKRLVACANIFPIQSLFWWGGKIEDGKEVAIVTKTKEEHFEKVRQEIKRLHSHEVPCIVGINLDKVDKEYAEWLNKEVR